MWKSKCSIARTCHIFITSSIDAKKKKYIIQKTIKTIVSGHSEKRIHGITQNTNTSTHRKQRSKTENNNKKKFTKKTTDKINEIKFWTSNNKEKLNKYQRDIWTKWKNKPQRQSQLKENKAALSVATVVVILN